MEITNKQQKAIEQLARKYSLKMILLFGSQITFDAFEVYALQRYQEAMPLFRMHERAIKNFIYD
ncbi:MAG: hypothetical protein ABIG90_02230 [bacterium]